MAGSVCLHFSADFSQAERDERFGEIACAVWAERAWLLTPKDLPHVGCRVTRAFANEPEIITLLVEKIPSA